MMPLVRLLRKQKRFTASRSEVGFIGSGKFIASFGVPPDLDCRFIVPPKVIVVEWKDGDTLSRSTWSLLENAMKKGVILVLWITSLTLEKDIDSRLISAAKLVFVPSRSLESIIRQTNSQINVLVGLLPCPESRRRPSSFGNRIENLLLTLRRARNAFDLSQQIMLLRGFGSRPQPQTREIAYCSELFNIWPWAKFRFQGLPRLLTNRSDNKFGKFFLEYFDLSLASWLDVNSNLRILEDIALEIAAGAKVIDRQLCRPGELGSSAALSLFDRIFREPLVGLDYDEQDEYLVSVVVPVFNNWRFLISTCFPSLISDANFRHFEILLVDDGSTDGESAEICDRLARLYHNVRSIHLEIGGSGSASVPRNVGITEATGKYITFLDPDNRISENGYTRLLRILGEAASTQDTIGIICGYHRLYSAANKRLGRHTGKSPLTVHDTRDFLISKEFPVVSTQAALIDRELLLERKLTFVERAVGQDSLFGWQILLASETAIFTSDVWIEYFAERFGSVTNALGESYWRKAWIRETAQFDWLKREGLVEAYRQSRLVRAINDWYLPRARTTNNIETGQSFVRKLQKLYADSGKPIRWPP